MLLPRYVSFLLLITIPFLRAESQSANNATANRPELAFFAADDSAISYMGRIDFSNPKLPRFWASGVTVRASFTGPDCAIILNDQVLYGNTHNYIEVAVDNYPSYRLQLKGTTDTILLKGRPGRQEHHFIVCKDTESGIGYLELAGLLCEGLLPRTKPPVRKIEFIGNSITCGAGMDASETPCGQGKWYDQHRAWMSYGPLTARALQAQWHLTSVAGIGLIHSCCDMGITMPQVFDKVDQRDDSLQWDFSRYQYQPDVVTITLGQNDGIQDSTAFCNAYLNFIKKIRTVYPSAKILCLTSPMGNAELTAVLKRYLTGIEGAARAAGDGNVYTFFYSRQYSHGCGGHPDLAEHALIADELTAYLKKIMNW